MRTWTRKRDILLSGTAESFEVHLVCVVTVKIILAQLLQLMIAFTYLLFANGTLRQHLGSFEYVVVPLLVRY